MKEKILFVDDDQNVLSAYKRKLRKIYNITLAQNGLEAIELIKSNNTFNVIVSDFQMPGMNGVKFLTIARKISPKSIRILATGLADIDIAIKAINEGSIFRFLQKPLNDTVITNALNDAIRQYKLESIEKSDRLKNEFLTTLSHEIRTPLNSITNFVQILETELYEHMSDELKSFSSIIQNNSERLIRTIHLMLDLSMIYSSNYELKFSKLDLIKQIIEPLIEKYKRIAQEKKINLEYTSETESVELLLDEYTITQIISNLIDNSIKFTEHGNINVNIKSDDNQINFIVEDTGIGISEKFIPHIFDPFKQEINGYTRLYEGNGLGLALVKEFCRLNDFTISVKSKKNVGTTFNLSIKTP